MLFFPSSDRPKTCSPPAPDNLATLSPCIDLRRPQPILGRPARPSQRLTTRPAGACGPAAPSTTVFQPLPRPALQLLYTCCGNVALPRDESSNSQTTSLRADVLRARSKRSLLKGDPSSDAPADTRSAICRLDGPDAQIPARLCAANNAVVRICDLSLEVSSASPVQLFVSTAEPRQDTSEMTALLITLPQSPLQQRLLASDAYYFGFPNLKFREYFEDDRVSRNADGRPFNSRSSPKSEVPSLSNSEYFHKIHPPRNAPTKAQQLLGFWTTKEPSLAAFADYASHEKLKEKTLKESEEPRSYKPLVVDPLPASVPPVNSKWNGMPDGWRAPKRRLGTSKADEKDLTVSVGKTPDPRQIWDSADTFAGSSQHSSLKGPRSGAPNLRYKTTSNRESSVSSGIKSRSHSQSRSRQSSTREDSVNKAESVAESTASETFLLTSHDDDGEELPHRVSTESFTPTLSLSTVSGANVDGTSELPRAMKRPRSSRGPPDASIQNSKWPSPSAAPGSWPSNPRSPVGATGDTAPATIFLRGRPPMHRRSMSAGFEPHGSINAISAPVQTWKQLSAPRKAPRMRRTSSCPSVLRSGAHGTHQHSLSASQLATIPESDGVSSRSLRVGSSPMDSREGRRTSTSPQSSDQGSGGQLGVIKGHDSAGPQPVPLKEEIHRRAWDQKRSWSPHLTRDKSSRRKPSRLGRRQA